MWEDVGSSKVLQEREESWIRLDTVLLQSLLTLVGVWHPILVSVVWHTRGQVCDSVRACYVFWAGTRGKELQGTSGEEQQIFIKKIYMKNQIEGSSTGHLNPKIPSGFWTFLEKTDPLLGEVMTPGRTGTSLVINWGVWVIWRKCWDRGFAMWIVFCWMLVSLIGISWNFAWHWPGTFRLTHGHLDPVALPPQEPTGLSAEARSSDFESRLSDCRTKICLCILCRFSAGRGHRWLQSSFDMGVSAWDKTSQQSQGRVSIFSSIDV